jgi:hypothetical protein
VRRSSWVLALLLWAPLARAQDDDLARARFLDQQGVHAFADGRFRDAMTLFNESYRSGGPPSELWNVARCQLKLDDPEGARRTLERYLAHQSLSADDRAEGKRLLAEIEHRTSTFVVATSPAGATVTVDGQPFGVTPLASTLAPGPHDIKITKEGVAAVSKHVDARDGRAVVLSLALGPSGRNKHKHAQRTRRFSAEVGALATISSLGGAAVVDVAPSPELAAFYTPFRFRRVVVGFGVRMSAGFDTWSTSSGVSNTPLGGCSPPADYSGVELLATPTVYASYRTSRRVSLEGRLGFGAAIYLSGSPIAGDLFMPACAYGGSLAPDAYASLDVSVRFAERFRVLLFPATLDLHPAYVGARNDGSLDANEPWLRFGFGAAIAADL